LRMPHRLFLACSLFLLADLCSNFDRSMIVLL
jgi:hypothetical protein